METNTELLNRIEAHIKGRLAVAESRAASSELYEGKKIAYNSLLGFVRSIRTECAAQAQLVPSDVQETEIRRINITPNEVRYVIDAIPSYAGIFMDEDDAKKGLAIFKAGMLAERERLASCPTIKGWVARDENGQLWLYGQRPFRNGRVWTTRNGRYFIRIGNTLFNTLLPSLRWEDDPREVEIIVKLNQTTLK